MKFSLSIPLCSNKVHGTLPAARAGCGFTAIGSRLFVFSGQATIPNSPYKSAIGEKLPLLFHFFVSTDQMGNNVLL
jgi:hypothetical protein